MTTDIGEGGERGGATVYTVGHSNRGIDEFVGLLKAHGVDTLVDIRKLPGLNKYPISTGTSWPARSPAQASATST